MLKRTQQSFNSTFKPRASGLAPAKRSTQATRRQVSAACPLGAHCLACGTSQQLTRSHILTQKQFPWHAANPQNVITLCWADHCIWENEKAQFARLYPDVWAEKLRRMQWLEPNYYALFRSKHPH